jgi:hypothetical protein
MSRVWRCSVHTVLKEKWCMQSLDTPDVGLTLYESNFGYHKIYDEMQMTKSESRTRCGSRQGKQEGIKIQDVIMYQHSEIR